MLWFFAWLPPMTYNLALHYVGVDFDVALLIYSSLVAFVLFICGIVKSGLKHVLFALVKRQRESLSMGM